MLDALFMLGSPWTQPIDACATYTSAGGVTDVPVGLDTWLEGDPWSIPLYIAQTADPQRPLLYNQYAWLNVATGRWQRFGNSAAVELEILRSSNETFPYAGNVFSSTSAAEWTLPAEFNKSRIQYFHLPFADTPAPGLDGHLAAQQPNGSVVETYGTIVLSSGEVIALSYSVSDPSSMADGWQNGQTASMLPMYAGVVDDQEIARGQINHAIAITVPAALLVPSIEYPAFAFDRDALTGNPAYAGKLPMGARLALPRVTDLASLHLSTEVGAIFAASARTYGFIVVDRGGEGLSMRVRRNPATPNSSLHSGNRWLQADLASIFQRIRRVVSCRTD